jgi:hypothetical protein
LLDAVDFGAGAVDVVSVGHDTPKTLTCLNLSHKRIYEALGKGGVGGHVQVFH